MDTAPSTPIDGPFAGNIIQTAFVVEDIHAAMAQMTAAMGVGPWFLRERGRFAVQTYRGQPSEMELAIAMGYAGDMQYELIQQLDEAPSVYRDVVRARGYGLHHFGVAFTDYARGCAHYRAQGFELVYEAEVANAARVGYFDTGARLPAMIEVIEFLPATQAMFARFRAAATGWDGADPVRMRPPLAPAA